MKKEYDFSKGQRGRFYRPGVELNISVYLESDIAKVVQERARKRNVSIAAVVNDWLRKDIRSRDRARRQKVRYNSSESRARVGFDAWAAPRRPRVWACNTRCAPLQPPLPAPRTPGPGPDFSNLINRSSGHPINV